MPTNADAVNSSVDQAIDRETEAGLAAIAERMISAGRQLCLAESCTGGGMAEMVTRISGSSAWFDRGWVTYSNAAKQALLGVDPSIFERVGAVSDECVEAMVRGALANSDANYAIAVSGVAGPGGGSAEKPVGTVWMAWGYRSGVDAGGVSLHRERFRFDGDRATVRAKAVRAGLSGLAHHLDHQAWPEGDWLAERWPPDVV